MCFGVMAKYRDIPLTFETVKKVFDIRPSDAHFPFFQFRVRPNFTFFEALISSLGINWWKKYFFARPALKERQVEAEREQWVFPKKCFRGQYPDWAPIPKNYPSWLQKLNKRATPSEV